MTLAHTTQTAMNIADDAALSNLYQHLLEGWNRGSGEVFAAPFTEDADFVAFDGTYIKGRTAHLLNLEKAEVFNQIVLKFLRRQ